ncbi:MAG: hypothetical protein H0U59_13320 [Gemmatimonadaceae bacterium]|nr:hypothetical protein [Gemmatimonadaceae bacterium]
MKWVGGCLLAAIVLVGVFMWWGYRAMQDSLAPDGSASVTIAATPGRVFASLAHGDSAATWRAEGNLVTTSRHGPLVPGDSLRIQMRQTVGMPSQTMTWQVKEVVPDRVMVLQLMTDSTHRVLAVRRDSLSAFGDSTTVVSMIVPAPDSARPAGTEPRAQEGDGLLGLSSDLLLSMFRMQSKLELMRLKARIEGSVTTRAIPP